MEFAPAPKETVGRYRCSRLLRVGLLVLAGLSSAVAQASSDSSGIDDQRRISEQFIAERLSVWKERLKLTDWNITVVLARRSELKPKTLGGTRWDKKKKTATIWILDPADYKLSFAEMLKDMELTTVHELVHIELSSLPKSEASRSTEEYAVNSISEALLAMQK